MAGQRKAYWEWPVPGGRARATPPPGPGARYPPLPEAARVRARDPPPPGGRPGGKTTMSMGRPRFLGVKRALRAAFLKNAPKMIFSEK
jgi:hypothetical protein